MKHEARLGATLALCLAIGLPMSGYAATDPDRQGVRWAGLPILNYMTDLGVSAGALAQRFDYGDGSPETLPFHTLWSAELSLSSQGPRLLTLGFEQTHVGDSAWRIGVLADYTLNPFEPFYGIGADTSVDRALARADFYDYRWESAGLALSARHPLGALEIQLGLSGARETSTASVSPSLYGSTFGSAPRSDTLVKASAALLWERRDSEFIPSRGWRGLIALSGGAHTEGSAWPRLDLDYRRYDPLWPDRALVLATQLRFTASGGNAPLHDRARLGSLGTLRGLPYSRYLANGALTARTELRSLFFRGRIFDLPLKAGAGLFVDTGKTGLSLADLAESPLRYAWGFTLFGSYFTDDFLGSMDVGFSQGSSAVYVRFGHAF